MYFRQNLQGVKEGEAIDGEVGEALRSNGDEKEEALKGRFKVSMKLSVGHLFSKAMNQEQGNTDVNG
jgi:hypothetical protein